MASPLAARVSRIPEVHEEALEVLPKVHEEVPEVLPEVHELPEVLRDSEAFGVRKDSRLAKVRKDSRRSTGRLTDYSQP